jgi:hypothetical protein
MRNDRLDMKCVACARDVDSRCPSHGSYCVQKRMNLVLDNCIFLLKPSAHSKVVFLPSAATIAWLARGAFA